jgi:hypothetical protein
MSDDESVERTESFTVSNEFGTVEVRKIHTGRGERLELRSVGLGHSIRLDALQLESITWQDSETFSEFMRTPFGPEGEDGDGAEDD